ncbi:histidine--tRNA ligase [Patescibacteria group bacterium]
MKKIEPKILKGTREFLPADKAKRDIVLEKILSIFKKFGYDSIETPVLCPAETILGKYGDEGEKLTYNFIDNGGRGVALPYDQTVPFARLVAANSNNLPMPFKRYQTSRVWRADKPQKGRYREFRQCDIDIIGSKSLICEAEIAKLTATVFEELGFKQFQIKFNSRRLLSDILGYFQIPGPQQKKVIQTIDKLAKIGEQNVVIILKDLGIDKANEIIELLKPEKDNQATLKKLSKFDISEIKEFMEYCANFDINEKFLKFDPSLARGLDYYTGINYEVYSTEADYGALAAGGRYDDLCGMFCNKNLSGVGIAFGFDRIVLGMEQLGKLDEIKTNSQVMVTIFDKDSIKNSLNLYNSLTDAGINSEIYFEPAKLSKQFKFANKKGIPFVVIQGPEEMNKKQIAIKNMNTGDQKTIPEDQLSSYINNYYNA